MGTRVILYCDDSPICKSARQFLKFNKVEFENVDIGTDSGYADFRRISYDSKIPVFCLKKSHSIHVIHGLDRTLLESELRLNKGVQKTLSSE